MRTLGRVLRALRERGLAGTARAGAAHVRERYRTQLRERRFTRQVRADVLRSRARIAAADRGRGLFIDCGSNLGQGFERFEKWFPLSDYDFLLVEPNPHCAEALRQIIARRGGNIELLPAAASTARGQTKFFGLTEDSRGKTSDGGSILHEHNSALYDTDAARAITVPTFSLADLLLQKAANYPSVIVKLDIEGAEYDALEQVLAQGAAETLEAIYVEFHSQYMLEPQRSRYRQREVAIQREFARRGVPFRLWW